MQIGCDRVDNTLYPLKLQQLVLASQPSYMSTSKSSSTFFTGNIGYPHGHYYWSSLARATQSYDQMDDPKVRATHSPVLDRLLLWTGSLCSIQPFLSKDMEEICHLLFKLWSGTADPGTGLFIFPFRSISVHLHCTASLYLCSWCCGCSWPWYRVIHQQGTCLAQKILKLLGVCLFLFFFFFSECWNAYIPVTCFLFSATLCWVVTHTEPDFTYIALFSLNDSLFEWLVLHS